MKVHFQRYRPGEMRKAVGYQRMTSIGGTILNVFDVAFLGRLVFYHKPKP